MPRIFGGSGKSSLVIANLILASGGYIDTVSGDLLIKTAGTTRGAVRDASGMLQITRGFYATSGTASDPNAAWEVDTDGTNARYSSATGFHGFWLGGVGVGRALKLSGSAAGNPTIDVSAGSLAITPAVIGAAQFSATAFVSTGAASSYGANSTVMNNSSGSQIIVVGPNAGASNIFKISQVSTDFSVNFDPLTISAAGGFTFSPGGLSGVTMPVVAGANRNIILSGSNAGNPTINVSAGSLAITPDIIVAGSAFSNNTVHAYNTTAVPAGGSAGVGFRFSSVASFGIFFGSGAPSLAAAKGSIYLNSTGSGIADRLYVNTNGTTGWTNFVSAA